MGSSQPSGGAEFRGGERGGGDVAKQAEGDKRMDSAGGEGESPTSSSIGIRSCRGARWAGRSPTRSLAAWAVVKVGGGGAGQGRRRTEAGGGKAGGEEEEEHRRVR